MTNEPTTEKLIVCTLCGLDTVEAGSGYCGACAETVSEQIDGAYESLMPLVVHDGETSAIARVLWENGWRVVHRETPNAPRCTGCEGEWAQPLRAAVYIGAALNEIKMARSLDARLGRRRAPPAEIAHWVSLCARVFSHLGAASLSLRFCEACGQKQINNAPKILRPV